MPRLTLSIHSDLEDVSLLGVAIKGLCLYLGLGSASSNEAELCVVEAVTNVILHAYNGERGYAVDVAMWANGDKVVFEITDSGTAMTSRQAEVLMHGTSRGESEPQNSEPLNFQSLNKDALAESGRGLQIIHDLMDEVTYARNVEGNCLTLTKRIGETNRR